MVYKKLYLSVSIRVISLSLTLFLLVYSWQKWNDPLILVNLMAIVILQAILFIRNMNQVNNKLAIFIESLNFDDTSLFNTRGFQDRSYRQLYRSMQDVIISVQKKNSDNYKQKQFYQTINEHTGTALLACNHDGKVVLQNHAFKNLFNIPDVQNVSEIESRIEGFVNSTLELNPGEQNLISFSLGSSGILEEATELELSVKKALIRIENEDVHILSFQNIKPELDNKESESWEKIIRVLTHEIMNTSGPLVSSAQTLIELVVGENRDITIQPGDFSKEMIHDLLEGLKIIEDRSKGLDKFVKDFRRVTLLPDPAFESIVLSEMINNLCLLYAKKLKDDKILLSVEIPDDICIFADKGMMEQLLINLLNNAIDAVGQSEIKNISVSAGKQDHKVSIKVSDTGSGLSPEDLAKVFIPFYTKKKHGSGIGLSLARQIMRKHGGTVSMKSIQGEGSTVVLDGLTIA